jgi:hypothetical protein
VSVDHRWRVTAGAALVALLAGCGSSVHGQPSPVLSATANRTSSIEPLPSPLKPDWTTLINPAVGLSYQVPPTDWTPKPEVGTTGTVTLTQGATRSPYNCGSPAALYLRGAMGSGRAPKVDPRTIATAVATAAAQQFYVSGSGEPQITVVDPKPVSRQTPTGHTVTGVLAQVHTTETGDPCLASTGEIYVLVLALSDHDAVFMVSGDLTGGPADPKPPTDNELRTMIDSAQPIGG